MRKIRSYRSIKDSSSSNSFASKPSNSKWWWPKRLSKKCKCNSLICRFSLTLMGNQLPKAETMQIFSLMLSLRKWCQQRTPITTLKTKIRTISLKILQVNNRHPQQGRGVVQTIQTRGPAKAQARQDKIHVTNKETNLQLKVGMQMAKRAVKMHKTTIMARMLNKVMKALNRIPNGNSGNPRLE